MPSRSEVVSIVSLAIYVPLLFPTIYLVIKHGSSRSSGWFYLILFCLLRVIGSAVSIYAALNPSDVTAVTWGIAISGVALSPLLWASMGLLRRALRTTPLSSFAGTALRIVLVAAVIALILIAAGSALFSTALASSDSSSLNSNSDYNTGTALSKTGAVLLTLTFAAYAAFALFSTSLIDQIPAGEKRALGAVLASIPFYAVRLAYTVAGTFVGQGLASGSGSVFSAFNTTGAAIGVRVGMALVPELVVVLLFVGAGLVLRGEREGARYGPVRRGNGSERWEYVAGGEGGERLGLEDRSGRGEEVVGLAERR